MTGCERLERRGEIRYDSRLLAYKTKRLSCVAGATSHQNEGRVQRRRCGDSFEAIEPSVSEHHLVQ